MVMIMMMKVIMMLYLSKHTTFVFVYCIGVRQTITRNRFADGDRSRDQ